MGLRMTGQSEWEYKVVPVDEISGGNKIPEQKLNNWGQRGWELINYMEKSGVLLFKKPVLADPSEGKDRICPKCGEESDPKANYCGKCGFNFRNND